MRICKDKKVSDRAKLILERFYMNDSTNDKEPIGTLKIQRSDLGVRKPKGSDINWYNPYENLAIILLVALKVLMFQTPFVIAKK
jgi:hypothetical protein